MSGTTPVSKLRYATLGDAPNANILSQNLATDLDHVVIPKYATTSARDTANPSPTDGDVCYVNTKGYMSYSSSASAWGLMFSAGGPKMQAFSTVWNTSTGSATPHIGSGTLSLRYQQMGGLCFVKFFLQMASDSTFGGGTTADNWQWSLPLAFGDTSSVYGGNIALQGTNTGDDATTGIAVLIPGQQCFSIGCFNSRFDGTAIDNAGFADKHTPFAWTANSGSFMSGQFFYECTN